MIQRIIFILFFLCSCANADDYSHIKVIEVIDGDTVKLSNGKLLRYIGIDTPELRTKKGDTFVYNPQPFAEEAKAFNQQLVKENFVKIEFDVEKYDQYKRLLGYCFVNETLVNTRLLEEGLAVLYTKPPNVAYSNDFINAQKRAREQKKGMWAAYDVIEHSQAHQYIGQIRTVRGRICKTYDSGKVIFLNFGANHKTDFTVVIFHDALKGFQDKGIAPLSFYKGKTIQVSGRIREYNGPEIIVNIPEEIEVIADANHNEE